MAIAHISSNWSWALTPAQESVQTRVFLNQCGECSVDDSFYRRHFALAGNGALAWISVFFDALSFTSKALGSFSLCLLTCGSIEHYTQFFHNTSSLLVSIKLIYLLPPCLGLGWFFPSVFSSCHYQIPLSRDEAVECAREELQQTLERYYSKICSRVKKMDSLLRTSFFNELRHEGRIEHEDLDIALLYLHVQAEKAKREVNCLKEQIIERDVRLLDLGNETESAEELED